MNNQDNQEFLKQLEQLGKDNGYYRDYPVPPLNPHVCPNCGYCPHCGRRQWPHYPVYGPVWYVTNDSYTYC